jgi:hypothetical protein
MSMKPVREDGGECWRKWYRTRKATLLGLSGPPPMTLCVDQMNLTVCCRFAELLLKSPGILKYLYKNHASELQKLQKLLVEFDATCRSAI